MEKKEDNAMQNKEEKKEEVKEEPKEARPFYEILEEGKQLKAELDKKIEEWKEIKQKELMSGKTDTKEEEKKEEKEETPLEYKKRILGQK